MAGVLQDKLYIERLFRLGDAFVKTFDVKFVLQYSCHYFDEFFYFIEVGRVFLNEVFIQ